MKRPFIPKRHGNATKEQIERIKPSRKPPRLTPTQILTIRQLFRTGTSQMQIARDFTAQGVPLTLTGGGVVARLDGGSFTVTPDARPDRTGAQVAQAIYRGFARCMPCPS